MAEEIDLSGVSPARRAEMLRRVGAVKRYLRLPSPTHDDDERHAAELEMGVAQFLNLVRAWREHGKASAMPGARMPTSPRRRRPSIAPEVENVVAEELSRLGILVRPADLHRAVVATCTAKNLPVPSLDLVKARVFSARSNAAPVQAAPTVAVLDHVALALPIWTESDGIGVPVISFVADQGNGRILGHSLSLRPPSPQAAARALLSALLTATPSSAAPAWPLVMASDATVGWESLLDLLRACGVRSSGRSGTPVPSGRAARMLFGTGIAGIRLRPRLVHAPSRVVTTKLPGARRPLSLEQADDAIDAAIVTHNASRDLRAFALTDFERRTDLIDQLTVVSSACDEDGRRR